VGKSITSQWRSAFPDKGHLTRIMYETRTVPFRFVVPSVATAFVFELAIVASITAIVPFCKSASLCPVQQRRPG